MKSRSTRDPDPGPPGLLVVAYGSLHGADDLHHFLVVHDSCPLDLGAALSREALVSLAAGSPELLERLALHSRRGGPGWAGKPRKQKGGPPKGGRRPSRRRDKGGPARNESRPRKSGHGPRTRPRTSAMRSARRAACREEGDGKGWTKVARSAWRRLLPVR